MGTFRDLSGNGAGVVIDPKMSSMNLAVTDAVVPAKTNYLRANGTGNITLRPAGGDADIIIPAKDGEYIPVDPGSIVRKTGTTVVNVLAMASVE